MSSNTTNNKQQPTVSSTMNQHDWSDKDKQHDEADMAYFDIVLQDFPISNPRKLRDKFYEKSSFMKGWVSEDWSHMPEEELVVSSATSRMVKRRRW